MSAIIKVMADRFEVNLSTHRSTHGGTALLNEPYAAAGTATQIWCRSDREETTAPARRLLLMLVLAEAGAPDEVTHLPEWLGTAWCRAPAPSAMLQ